MVLLYDAAWRTRENERKRVSEIACVWMSGWLSNEQACCCDAEYWMLWKVWKCVRARVWWTLLKMTRISVQEAAWMWHIRVTRSSQLFIHIDVRHYPFNKFNSFSRSTSVGISSSISISINGSNNIAPWHGCLFSRSLVRSYACLFAPTSTYRECQQFNLGK